MFTRCSNKWESHNFKFFFNFNSISDWISPVPSNQFKAFCRICQSELKAHKAVLRKHQQSPEHQEKSKAEGIVTELPKFIKQASSEEQKKADIRLAVYVAEHSAIRSVDHLGELLSKNHSESQTLANLKLHRTKCTYLLTNVIAPSLHEELVKDVEESNNRFSLILDESTDVACDKSLGVVIRYYSELLKTVVTTLYCLLHIQTGDAQSQVDAICKQLSTDSLPIDHLIGIGVDGANVNTGSHHSVSTLLKSKVPHLITFKCICHSLHLAASKAMDSLPRHLDFMIRETCSWFSMSTKRQSDYRALYETLCDGQSPLKLGKHSETRWLSRFEIVKKIIDQWDELQLHFQMARTKERCYAAEQLYAMFSDSLNKIYLTFLCSELEAICRLNKAFQSDSADVTKLFGDLNDYVFSVLQKIIPPSYLRTVKISDLSSLDFSGILMSPSAVHLGYAAHLLIDSLQLSNSTIQQIKDVCFCFLKELAVQLKKRLPDNFSILKHLDLLSPRNATAQMKDSILPFASNFPTLVSNLDALEREWKLLHTKTWTSTNNVVEFWSEVHQARNASGERSFEHVSKFALSLLSLPFSNASVERSFSQMNLVKSKLRNRMLIKTTNALLQVISILLLN